MAIQIFVAFDMKHDQDLCDELVASSGRKSIFEISGRSAARANPEDWERTTQARVAAAEQVVVVCGEHTDASVSVAAELRMAREENKPVILLWSRREAMCKKPTGTLPSDNMYSWTPDILGDQLSANRRNANKTPVPERLKRREPTADGSGPS